MNPDDVVHRKTVRSIGSSAGCGARPTPPPHACAQGDSARRPETGRSRTAPSVSARSAPGATGLATRPGSSGSHMSPAKVARLAYPEQVSWPARATGIRSFSLTSAIRRRCPLNTDRQACSHINTVQRGSSTVPCSQKKPARQGDGAMPHRWIRGHPTISSILIYLGRGREHEDPRTRISPETPPRGLRPDGRGVQCFGALRLRNPSINAAASEVVNAVAMVAASSV